MKGFTRLFLASVLAFTFAIFGATLSPSTSYAEDVWAYSSEWGDDYVITDEITLEKDDGVTIVNVKVKQVKDGKVAIHPVSFFKGANDNNDNNITWSAMTGTGMRNLGPITYSAYASSIWKVVKNYI